MMRVVVMAGGTGGHVFPALAVARELQQQSVEVIWLGSRGGMEERLVAEAGLPLELISIGGLRGKGLKGWFAAPFRLTRALFQALSILRRTRPDAVVGFGGFVTGPGGLAAWLLRRPLLIHEQNALPGLTNRLLASLARRVMEGFPGTFANALHTGNPVRGDIAALAPPAQRFAGRSGPLRLLVIGGSRGAVALNRTVPEALARLEPGVRPTVRHQAGGGHLEAAQSAYREAGVAAEISEFIGDMAEAYRWADLVLCRAGALTVAELAAAGLGAVLVPFPYAVDDHQTYNAHFLVDAGAADLLAQDNMDAGNLGEMLEGYVHDAAAGRKDLLLRAERARALAAPDAARKVADICLAAGRMGNE